MKSFHLLQLKMLNKEKNCQWNKIITAIFKVKKKKKNHNFSCINRHFLDT